MQQSTCLIVTGMHRSGTSLLAEAVASLGISVGNALVPANEFNPRGYFEDAEVVALHDALLDSLGHPWGSPAHARPLPKGWQNRRASKDTCAAIQRYLAGRRDASAASVFAVKDPRLCLFLPLWQRAAREIDVELRVLVALRSPGAVSRSLQRRDSIPPALGQALWLHYLTSLLLALKPGDGHVIRDADWRSDPDAQIARIAAVAGVADIRPVEPVYQGELRNADDEPGSGLARQLFECLSEDSDKPVPAAARRMAADFRAHAVALDPIAAELSGDASDHSRLARDLATYRAAHRHAEEELLRLQGEAENSTKRAARDAEADARVRRTYVSALTRLAADHAAALETIAAERARTKAAAQRALRLHDSSLAKEREDREMRDRLSAQLDQIAVLESEIKRLAAMLRDAEQTGEIRARNYDTAVQALHAARDNMRSLTQQRDDARAALDQAREINRSHAARIAALVDESETMERAIAVLKQALAKIDAKPAKPFRRGRPRR